MHRRFQREGRTPSNAMDRRDCDALQMNIVMQLTSLLGHVKSEWQVDPEKVTKLVLDDTTTYVKKRLEMTGARPKIAPEYYPDEDEDEEDDIGIDYTKAPPKGKKGAPTDGAKTSTPRGTKPASTLAADKTPGLMKRLLSDLNTRMSSPSSPEVVATPQRRTRSSTSTKGKGKFKPSWEIQSEREAKARSDRAALRAAIHDSEANKLSSPKKDEAQDLLNLTDVVQKMMDNGDKEEETSVVICGVDDAAQEKEGEDDEEAEERQAWEREMGELEIQHIEVKRKTAETKSHVEEKKKRAEETKEKLKKAEKAKETEEKRKKKEEIDEECVTTHLPN